LRLDRLELDEQGIEDITGLIEDARKRTRVLARQARDRLQRNGGKGAELDVGFGVFWRQEDRRAS
jgi:hypothetical protein